MSFFVNLILRGLMLFSNQDRNIQEKKTLSLRSSMLEMTSQLNHVFAYEYVLTQIKNDPIDISGEFKNHCDYNPGIQTIQVPEHKPFRVLCRYYSNSTEMWLVIHRRMNNKLSFNRNWANYVDGFYGSSSEFFIGLSKLQALTSALRHELLIHLIDAEGKERYAIYDRFIIGNENDQYTLKSLGSYTGTAGDDMRSSVGQKFSTYDRDNDGLSINCASFNAGAWWYQTCQNSNLNGECIVWNTWHDRRCSIKIVHMMIRPKY